MSRRGLSVINFYYLGIVCLSLLHGNVDSYSLFNNGRGNLHEEYGDDYVSDTIDRLSRSAAGHHVHKSRQVEFQCLQKSKEGEGRENREGESHKNSLKLQNYDEMPLYQFFYNLGMIIGKALLRNTYNLAESTMCHPNKRSEIMKSHIALGCKTPHMKIIKLKSPGPNYDLIPSVAKVKRCSGHCTQPWSCMPVKKSIVRIPVYKIDKINNMRRTCVDYELEEHEECECGCNIQSLHCNKNQTHDPSRCACMCNNLEEKVKCLRQRDLDDEGTMRYWDDTTCQCSCVEMECPSPRLWVPSLCRCVRVTFEENDLY